MTYDDAVQDQAVQSDAGQDNAHAEGGSTATAAAKPGPPMTGAPKPGPGPGAAPKPGPGDAATPEPGSPEGSDQVPEPTGSSPAAGSGLVTPPAVATREPTGDVVVDAVLDEFDRVTGEPLDAHVEVGEKVHRTLQARLADLGDE
ncbi:MAG: hypothetical protein ACTHJ6_08050 [Oryzihumus sp.]